MLVLTLAEVRKVWAPDHCPIESVESATRNLPAEWENGLVAVF